MNHETFGQSGIKQHEADSVSLKKSTNCWVKPYSVQHNLGGTLPEINIAALYLMYRVVFHVWIFITLLSFLTM